MHRIEANATVARVDAARQLLDLLLQAGVLGHVCARRHGDLNEAHALVPLGVRAEEALEAVELLRDALDVVCKGESVGDAAAKAHRGGQCQSESGRS